MEMSRNQKLLEVYSLEEILEALDLLPEDILDILEEQGYMDHVNLVLPL